MRAGAMLQVVRTPVTVLAVLADELNEGEVKKRASAIRN